MKQVVLVIPVFIPHRGCPHQCLFCNQQSITGQEGGSRRLKVEIGRTVEEWLARSPGRSEVQVAFYGGSFTCLAVEEQIEMLSSVRPFLDSGRVGSIRLSTRPDCIDSEICSLLRKFGVKTVELGVQSMDDRVLKKSRRGHTVLHSIEAFRLLRDAGMQVGIQLMIGLPAETTSSFLSGINEVIRLRPDFVRLYPVLVVENSELEDLYYTGEYHPLSLNRAVALTAKGFSRLRGEEIPVVRIGLQPSESLERSLVSGPYHPSFGELVKSRLWFKRIRKKLAALSIDEKITISVSHRDLSAINGMNRKNIKRLNELGFRDRYIIKADKSLERGRIKYVCSQ